MCSETIKTRVHRFLKLKCLFIQLLMHHELTAKCLNEIVNQKINIAVLQNFLILNNLNIDM